MKEQIAQVQDALSTDCRTKALKLTVRLDGDMVILEGHVTSYYHKQLAQHVVMLCAGGLRLRNEIFVNQTTDLNHEAGRTYRGAATPQ